MRRLHELAGLEISLVQPNLFKHDYEFHAGEEIAAVLHFRSAFGSLAIGESADGAWTFKRVGFWQTRVTVRPAQSETELAVFKNNTWTQGGTLEFPDGRVFQANTNFWKTEYEFKNPAGEPLVKFKQIGGFFHLSSQVSILPAAGELAELPVLVLLGGYLVVMLQRDSAAAAAATAS